MNHILKRSFVSKPIPSKSHHRLILPDASFPKGYLLTGLHCGVKKNSEQYDLALLLSTTHRPASAAGCFTTNAFKAAPVLVSEEILRKNESRARGIVVNSGCANAVTGNKGLENAWTMVRETDALIGRGGEGETLVMSTGVIGQHLPISKIVSGIRSARVHMGMGTGTGTGTGFDAWERAARAFMTTDTFPKLRSRVFEINGVEYRMGGIDKGAGMIHPRMDSPPQSLHATLLGCILTDAAVSPKSLQSALGYAVERSFNSISVDGEMSTNDTVLALANGAAATGEEIDEDRDKVAYEAFRDELTSFAVDLAQLVVRDGEGATKFVTITVEVRFVSSLLH
jgi:glutamate N-acetyltransferase / amino-acid N-acetyltransferase